MSRRIARAWLLFGALVCGMLGVWVADVQAAPKFVIRFNELNSAEHPMYRADLYFAEVLAKKTNGAIEVKNFANSQLGKGRDAIEGAQMGTLEMTQTMTANMSAFYPAFDVFTLPFLFRDREHLYKVIDGPIGQELLRDLRKVGLVGLYYYDAGSRSFYNSKRPVKTLEDLKGLKIRVPQSTLMVETINALGAGAVPVEYAEVYSALQQGIVDGAENAPIAYYHMKHSEVAKYLSLSHHFRTPDVIVMSLATWEKLPKEYQNAVMEAGREASLYERRLWAEEEGKALAELKAKGVAINEVNDIARFRDKVKPVWDKYKSQLPKGLIERILETK